MTFEEVVSASRWLSAEDRVKLVTLMTKQLSGDSIGIANIRESEPAASLIDELELQLQRFVAEFVERRIFRASAIVERVEDRTSHRQNIRTAIADRRKAGFVVGTVPYGWEAQETDRSRVTMTGDVKTERVLVPNLDQLKVLREHILPLRYQNGWGSTRIAHRLNELGIATRVPAGTPVKGYQGLEIPSRGIWTPRHIDRILNNKYTMALARQLGYEVIECKPSNSSNIS